MFTTQYLVRSCSHVVFYQDLAHLLAQAIPRHELLFWVCIEGIYPTKVVTLFLVRPPPHHVELPRVTEWAKVKVARWGAGTCYQYGIKIPVCCIRTTFFEICLLLYLRNWELKYGPYTEKVFRIRWGKTLFLRMRIRDSVSDTEIVIFLKKCRIGWGKTLFARIGHNNPRMLHTGPITNGEKRPPGCYAF